MRKRQLFWSCALSAALSAALCASATAARADAPAPPWAWAPAARADAPAAVAATAEGDYVVRDFHFASGETLPELRLHYTTLGKPHRDPHGRVNNAILIMHGTGGSGRSLLNEHFAGVLFG